MPVTVQQLLQSSKKQRKPAGGPMQQSPRNNETDFKQGKYIRDERRDNPFIPCPQATNTLECGDVLPNVLPLVQRSFCTGSVVRVPFGH